MTIFDRVDRFLAACPPAPEISGFARSFLINVLVSFRAGRRERREMEYPAKQSHGETDCRNAPYGFRPGRKRGQRVFLPFVPELRVLKKIAELRNNDDATWEAIANALRRAGVRSRRGGEIPAKRIRLHYLNYRRMLAEGTLPAGFEPRPKSDDHRSQGHAGGAG
jgi:hypothetical protein